LLASCIRGGPEEEYTGNERTKGWCVRRTAAAQPRRSTIMKTITTLLALAVLTGCDAHVSIREVESSDPSLGPSIISEVSGSSRALEKEARVLLGQRSGDEKNDQMIYRKTEAIRDTLMDRGYLVQYKFILPNVVFEPKMQKELREQIKKFGERNTSSTALAWIGPLDGGARSSTPIRITVVDRKTNIQNWKKFLERIDNGVKVEPGGGKERR